MGLDCRDTRERVNGMTQGGLHVNPTQPSSSALPGHLVQNGVAIDQQWGLQWDCQGFWHGSKSHDSDTVNVLGVQGWVPVSPGGSWLLRNHVMLAVT